MNLILRFLFGPGPNSRATNLGLLALRLWFGLSILLLHGWVKLGRFDELSNAFPDPFGLGSQTSLVLAILAEVLGSALVVVGLVGRLAALSWVATMVIAFPKVHGATLTGEPNGELAFVYLGVAVALLIAGPGRFSLDARLFGRRSGEAPVAAKK